MMSINNYVSVQNLNNTTDIRYRIPPDGFGTWKEFWEKKMDRKFDKCANIRCEENAVDGSHVQIKNAEDHQWYIVPFCKGCNHKIEEITVAKSDLCPLRGDKK